MQRAVSVVDALADADAELGTNELARRTGINASTVSRLLATLVEGGLVEHVPESGRYRLGVRFLQLGNIVLGRLDLRRIARPHLHALVEATGETATLSAPGERDAVTVDFVQSTSSVQGVAQLGRPSIAHATATGKVLLAFGLPALPPGGLKEYTPRTITQRAALAAELSTVRERGYAVNFGEREDDLHALAAPVWGPRGELAAIVGVQGPAARFSPREMDAAVLPLLEHTLRLSHELGWSGLVEAVRSS
ncbi:MAG: IclR family transcriptional regulator, regulon repressor [Gaiellaceae bacterium]|nr:IclR family transcriptional regulator, regulon repressor [Gaiellaceae bacterium]MDX6469329.1 IclR family transcriptional regulator, regulon repressor [Gaiellaceae bacterium]MDX6472383.1 IclR family transcriptional regulator, regulon repressor [Gaiellaceae bacterium]